MQSVSLTGATSQQHAVNGMTNALFGNGNQETGSNRMLAFVGRNIHPHGTQRIGDNRRALSIEAFYLNLAAQLLAFI